MPFPFFVAPVAVTAPAPAPQATAQAAPSAAGATKTDATQGATPAPTTTSPTPPPLPTFTPGPSDTTPRKPTTPPTTPTEPTPAIDPDTGRPVVPRDPTTGQPIPQTDETGQPLIEVDETGQILPPALPEYVPPADSLLRASDRAGAFDPSQTGGAGRGLTPAGYWRYRLGLALGYSTNAVETALPSGAVEQHGGVFQGINGGIDYFVGVTPRIDTSVRAAFRLLNYSTYATSGSGQLAGGTFNAGWSGTAILSARTTTSASVTTTTTSADSALASDGPLFVIDPRTLTRVYTIGLARVTLAHELGPTWRVVAGSDVVVNITHSGSSIPVPGTNYSIDHHGFDSVSPSFDVSLNHDFSPFDIGSIIGRYTIGYAIFALDLSTPTPTYGGQQVNHSGTVQAAWTHGFSPEWRSIARFGGGITEAPPTALNPHPIFVPTGGLTITYTKPLWSAWLDGTYSTGSLNPSLGFGSSESIALTAMGVPVPQGKWSALSLVAVASLAKASYNGATGAAGEFDSAAGSFTARYGVSTWLGVVCGYNGRYFQTAGGTVPFYQHMAYVGLSGYFSSDHSLPTVDTFAVPVTPPQ